MFGPNEYHKGEMMSLVAKRFDDAKAGKPVRLFKSHRDGIADGEQKRDFIYVDDAVAVVRWLLDTPPVSGIFNVGTGKARSFRDLITAMFAALGREPDIEYVDMPAAIRDQLPVFHASRGRKPAPRRLQRGLHAARRRGAALRHPIPRSRRPLSLRHARSMHAHVRLEDAREHRRQQTVLCVGDLMLDDFVYGEVVAHLAGGAGAGAGGRRAARW